MWLVAGVILGLGALCLVVGVRGRRVGEHPVCRGCGFDLVGLAERGKCPECGADVSGAKGVRIGIRRRGRGLMALGALLTVVGVAGLGVLVWGSATKFNWNTVKPAWLLLRETRGGRPDEDVIKELARRLRAGELAASDVGVLIDRALTIQGDTTATWGRWWPEIIEGGRQRGVVSDEQWTRYAEQAAADVKLETEYNQFARRKGQLYFAPYFSVGEGRGGLSLSLGRHFRIEQLVFDGKEVPIPADWRGNRDGGGSSHQLSVRGGFSHGLMPVPDASGKVQVEIVVIDTIEDQAAEEGKRVVAKWTRRFTGEFDATGAKDDGYPPLGPDGWARGAGNPADWRPMGKGPSGGVVK